MRHTGRVPGHAEGNEDGAASFVGRSAELAALRAALTEQRLITVTGPGGVGKTRLVRQALAAADGPAGPARPFPDGIHWADLAPLPGERLLVDTVADALDLADHTPRTLAEAVAEWIGARRLLLVLDCCEHLIAPVRGLVHDLLEAAPHLVVLLTSRSPSRWPPSTYWSSGRCRTRPGREKPSPSSPRGRTPYGRGRGPRRGWPPPARSAPASKGSPSRWNSPPRS